MQGLTKTLFQTLNSNSNKEKNILKVSFMIKPKSYSHYIEYDINMYNESSIDR